MITVGNFKKYLRKYEHNMFKINSRSSGLSEYMMVILSKQVMQLNTKTKDSNQEIKSLNTKLEGIDIVIIKIKLTNYVPFILPK